jgi:hypothetical protein
MSRVIAFAVLMSALLAANGCGTSRKIASRIELQNISNEKPMTVYAEDHRTYELRHHALVDSVIRGTGTVSSAGKEARFDGTIPLTSIHAIETGSTNVLKGLAMMGMTALFVAEVGKGNGAKRGMSASGNTTYHYPYTGGGGGGIGESCPYVYAWNGERYVLEAEPFGVGFGRALELTTMHLLPSARSENGTVRLRLTNERPETHYVNSLALYAIDLGREPGAVLDDQGRAWPLSRREAPATASDRTGRDILADVASADGQIWECDPSTLTPGSGYVDVLDLAFVRPRRASTGSLVLTGINTSISTAIFSYMCRVLGNQAPLLVHAMETDPELIRTLRSYLDDAALKASIWNGREWQEAGAFRPEATAIAFTRALRIRVPESAGDTVRIRLRGMADVWKLDALTMDWTQASALPMKRLQLLSAVGPQDLDMRGLLDQSDGRYAILLPPDRIELTYAPALGARVVYAVEGRGYLHEWIPRSATSGLVATVSWVPEERRLDFLKDLLLEHRDVALGPIYEEWRRERLKK